MGLLFVLLAFVWGSQTTGLVSSNDGSHLALARALAVRGEATIDPEMALTLRVDLAERNGRYYSDRPPGNAFAAIPSVRLGHLLDPSLLARSRDRGKMLVDPACPLYIHTYAARVEGAPPLAGYMGTALMLALHTVLVGLAGLWCIYALLRRRGVDVAGRLFVLVSLGLGTLWGPYATVFFNHISAVAAVSGFLLALDRWADDDAPTWVTVTIGACGAWAVACDYLLALAIVPATLLCVRPGAWPRVLVGVLPLAIAVLAYHAVAFGSPFSIGYQHQANFEFARSTATTFDGNPVDGAWVLLGFGHDGAGLLAQAPIAVVGIAGWLVAPARDRSYLLAWLPWLALLCTHHTPWGGASEDHRYLTPLLPLIGLGLGLAWKRWLIRQRALMVAAAALAIVSVGLVWSHFLEWHETPVFNAPWVGVFVAATVLVAWSIGAFVLRRRAGKTP